MRPTIAQLSQIVDEFFWKVRSRGKPPVERALSKNEDCSLNEFCTIKLQIYKLSTFLFAVDEVLASRCKRGHCDS